MGLRINTIMQTCFFAISGVLPQDEAIAQIKNSIKKTYSSKGEDVVIKNYEAVDKTLAELFRVDLNGNHRFRVEHVELGGFATLGLKLKPVE